MTITFDPAAHAYTIDGQPVPNVTSILRAVLRPAYIGATDWHMERGRIVHQCAAMIADGIPFVHDPAIDGQVRACRGWFEMRKPEVIATEHRVGRSEPIPYAGTLDLLCRIAGKVWIIDWKASPSPCDQWQLAAYAWALEASSSVKADFGLVVQLTESGTPREGKPVNLRTVTNEWRSVLNVYTMMQREGMINE
jgi:hypothetical protein